jgi:hypothetical protein
VDQKSCLNMDSMDVKMLQEKMEVLIKETEEYKVHLMPVFITFNTSSARMERFERSAEE